jgi:hypothetical protein
MCSSHVFIARLGHLNIWGWEAVMLPFVVILNEVNAQEVDPEVARPGGVAGLFFLGLLIATVVLFRSMNRHLRVARENLTPRSSDQDAVDGVAGAGIDASRGSGGEVDTGDTGDTGAPGDSDDGDERL